MLVNTRWMSTLTAVTVPSSCIVGGEARRGVLTRSPPNQIVWDRAAPMVLHHTNPNLLGTSQTVCCHLWQQGAAPNAAILRRRIWFNG